MSRHGREEDRLSGLLWGIGMVAVGTVILLQYLDVLSFRMWRAWWPLVVVLVGVGQLVASRTAKGIGDGVSLVLMGGWFYVAANEIWGLSWRDSWPLALVAVGMGMVVRSIAAGFMGRGRDEQEVRNDG